MRVTFIAAAVLCASWARAAGPDAPFDRDEIAVDDSDFMLLTEKGYSFDSEGMLRSPNRMTVSREDAAYLLEDLRSRRRLADLMEIKLIQDRAAAQGVMTKEDKAALRRIGQRDWAILSKSAKEQLKAVFSDRELYDLTEKSPKAPLPDSSAVVLAGVRASQAHSAVPLDQPLNTLSGTLMPLGVQPRAPARPPALPTPAAPAAPVAPAVPPAPPAAPAPAVVQTPVAPQAPVVPPPAPVAPPPAPVAPAPAAEVIPDDIKPLPAPWANEPPTPAPAALAPVPVQAAPAPAPPQAPTPVAAAAPAAPPPAPEPAAPAAPPPAPEPAAPPPPPVPQAAAVPAPPPPPAPAAAPAAPAPDAPAPLPSEDELDTASVEPAKAAAPPPQAPAALAGLDAVGLPAAVTAALAAAPPPPPQVAAVLPAPAAPALPPPGGFRVEAAAPPPVRQAEGLSPKALPTTASPAPAAPPPPPVVEGPPYPPVTPDAFSAFLAQAPYGREEKALLAMVSANLPEPERTRALGVLMKRLPHVVLDSRRAGTDSRVSVTMTGSPGQAPVETVALHDGPVLRSAEAFLKADQAWLLPDEPVFYTARGLPVPAAAAFSRVAASAGEQATKWGRARVYSDGSKRLSRSETALAGALARGLLLLDARTRMPGDAVGAELAARVGEFRLYQVLEKAADKEPPLDKETLALYNEWRDRPLDFVDTMAHGFFAVGAGARIAGEAGFGLGREPLSPPAPLPAAGSPAEAAWLESERLARERRE